MLAARLLLDLDSAGEPPAVAAEFPVEPPWFRRKAEPVKPGETPESKDQACGTSFSGRLIQTSAGTGSSRGGPLTKRSGWAA
jgi:hypothetical protein